MRSLLWLALASFIAGPAPPLTLYRSSVVTVWGRPDFRSPAGASVAAEGAAPHVSWSTHVNFGLSGNGGVTTAMLDNDVKSFLERELGAHVADIDSFDPPPDEFAAVGSGLDRGRASQE